LAHLAVFHIEENLLIAEIHQFHAVQAEEQKASAHQEKNKRF
jgi:hypothetical protein